MNLKKFLEKWDFTEMDCLDKNSSRYYNSNNDYKLTINHNQKMCILEQWSGRSDGYYIVKSSDSIEVIDNYLEEYGEISQDVFAFEADAISKLIFISIIIIVIGTFLMGVLT